MNVLPVGAEAPEFSVTTLREQPLSLAEALERAPVVLAFGLPHVHASRLVVGYLRRLKEQVPNVNVWVVLQGDERAVKQYSKGYLDSLDVIHDAWLRLSERYGVTHVPTVYYLTKTEDGMKVTLAFTGFSRAAMNRLAVLTAEATGAKSKELITPLDNKGEYELAERGLSGSGHPHSQGS